MEALLYDVHGNLPALEAVLADADADADRFILGGWPKETVERCSGSPDAIWLRGNGERWLTDPDTELMHPVAIQAVESAREALGDHLVDQLAALPTSARRGDTLFCHASPRSDIRSFMPEPADDEAELLNPGSVGLPFDGDQRASYVRVHDDGSFEHRRVRYDCEASADKVKQTYATWGELVSKRLAQARPDPS